MENPNLETFEKEGLVIEKDRVLTYSELICPLGCRYCFAEKLSGVQKSDVSYLSEKQADLLKNLPEGIKTIMLGCDTEFFQNKDEAVEILKKLSTLGKDVSVITKLSLSDNFVEVMGNISDEMSKRDNRIVFSVSIPCFESSHKWEPNVPSPEKRIDTLKKVSKKGIASMVAIRPLIPNIQKSEIDKIIDSTSPYVFGYYSGPLYIKDFDNELLSREEIANLGLNSEEVEPKWMPKGNKFIMIENPDLMAYLREKVEKSGKEFFDGAVQGIEFLRKK